MGVTNLRASTEERAASSTATVMWQLLHLNTVIIAVVLVPLITDTVKIDLPDNLIRTNIRKTTIKNLTLINTHKAVTKEEVHLIMIRRKKIIKVILLPRKSHPIIKNNIILINIATNIMEPITIIPKNINLFS